MKRETPREKVERLLSTVLRPFVIKINGIWTVVDGVYIRPVIKPYPIKCVYNGRFVFVSDNRHYFDFFGCDELDIENFIIQRNIKSLPKPKNEETKLVSFYRSRARVVPAEPIPNNEVNVQPAAPVVNPQDPITLVTPATGIVGRIIEPADFNPMPYIPLQVTPDLPTPNTH